MKIVLFRQPVVRTYTKYPSMLKYINAGFMARVLIRNTPLSRLLNLFSGRERMETFNKSRADYIIILLYYYTYVYTFGSCDSCPVRTAILYGKRNSLRYIIIIILLGVVTVFGSEPLVNIIGGVPTQRPCVYSYIIFVYVYIVFPTQCER